jgi:lipopolysaccharide transport system ATP-binding protein
VSAPALELRGVGKSYRRGGARSLRKRFLGGALPVHSVQVLRDVDLTVRRGEAIGVIGRNGGGKSTLLRVAAGLTTPSTGTVHRTAAVSGLFTLSAAANGELSGADNAVTAAVLAGLTPRQARARLGQIADFAELDEEILDEPLRTYSEGMKLRLAFAAAATMDPDLLLIDELLAVGDLGFQEKCLSHVEHLRDRGCALLIASHVMPHLRRLVTGVVWLRSGEVHAQGPADELLDAYERSQDEESGPPQQLSEGGYRRGTGQVLISGVSCLNAQDAPVEAILLGDRLTVRVEYDKDARVTAAAVSVSLRRVGTDVRIVDITTGDSGVGAVPLRDAGSITLTLERLDLEPGEYWVDVGIYSADWETVYDYRWDWARLVVLGPTGTNGFVQPPHRWATT